MNKQLNKSQCLGAATLAALAGLFFVMAVAWLLWSGIYKPVVIGLGAFSCVVTVYLARQMEFFEHSSELPKMLVRLPAYWLWLGREIITSSWDVTKLVLSPSMPIKPTLVRMAAAPKTEMAQTILGNSITLSPGTVTVDIHEDELLVHCITREGAEALIEGEANRRAAALEQR